MNSNPLTSFYPEPQKERWQPLRCGLFNIFRYDDQQFIFEDGHLLLRGSNGSGKTRVLALTLPFLLDARVDPIRMEPDRDRHKRVSWNLLMNKHEERTGYSWLEFGRRTEEGPVYLTLGCGLEAVKGRQHTRHWFFITSKRLGRDFTLRSENRVPFNQRQLEAQLDKENVFTTRKEYQQRVNKTLFGLSEYRYNALMDLLIELRQPQLSRKFDEAHLSQALSEALPPLDEGTIAGVAEAFQRLEQDKDDLERLKQVTQSMKRFLDAYQTYAKVAACRKGEEFRNSNAQFVQAGRERIEVSGLIEAANQNIVDNQDKIQDLQHKRESLAARLQTLLQSPEMAKAGEIEDARKAAAMAETMSKEGAQRLKQAGDHLAKLNQRLEETQKKVRDGEDQLTVQLDQSREQAQKAAFEDNFLKFQQRLDHGEALTRTLMDQAADFNRTNLKTRRADLDHIQRLNQAVKAAADHLERERRILDEISEQLVEVEERLQNAHKLRNEERKRLVEQVQEWVASLDVLPRDSFDELVEAFEIWSEGLEGDNPLKTQLNRSQSEVLENLIQSLNGHQTALRDLEQERQDLAQQRDELLAGKHQPPPAPHVRDVTARQSREGAPLWQLCDFKDSVAEAQRPALEAALEAAGLLDAWVTPDGRLLGDPAFDSFLSTHGDTVSPNLTDVLKPDLENTRAQVSEAVVTGILGRIGFGEQAGPVWVDSAGNWRLGPLSGSWAKQDVEHLGQTTREQVRRRRLAELEEALDQNRVNQDQERANIEEVQTRRKQLEQECNGLPSVDELRNAMGRVAAVDLERARLAERKEQREDRVRAASEDLRKKQDHRNREANVLGLFDYVDQLDQLRNALNIYEQRVQQVLNQFMLLLNLRETRTQQQQDAQQAAQDLETRDQEHQALQKDHREKASHFKTLQDTHGKTVEEVRRQLQEAKQKQSANEKHLDEANEKQADLRVELQRHTGNLERITERSESADQARRGHMTLLQRFAQAELLKLALPTVQADLKKEWNITHCLEVARNIDKGLGQMKYDDVTWQRLDGRIHGHYNTLRDELGPHGYEPYHDKIDDCLLVRIPFQGKQFTVREIHDYMDERIEERQTILGHKEHEVINQQLLGEISQVLRERLEQGRKITEHMSAEIKQRPTSSGLSLGVQWKIREDQKDDNKPLTRALKLLGLRSKTWNPEQRQEVAAFLQDRINDARDSDELGGWEDHLRTALDYRQWHQFQFTIAQDGRRVALNRASFGQKSGGEKVAALMLLQLAAASAHYRSAAQHAPRLILMDEAFVGVDDSMRENCMGMLKAFDLDFVMTSEREKGCYKTLPGVAICQINSDTALDAIYVHRLVWNGTRRIPDQYASRAHEPGPT